MLTSPAYGQALYPRYPQYKFGNSPRITVLKFGAFSLISAITVLHTQSISVDLSRGASPYHPYSLRKCPRFRFDNRISTGSTCATVHLPSADISSGIFSSDGTRPIHRWKREAVSFPTPYRTPSAEIISPSFCHITSFHGTSHLPIASGNECMQ